MDAPLEGEDKNALGNSFNAARRRGGRLAGKQNNGRRREPCAEHRRRRHRFVCGRAAVRPAGLFGAQPVCEHHCFGGGGVRVPVRGAQADKITRRPAAGVNG